MFIYSIYEAKKKETKEENTIIRYGMYMKSLS